MANPEAGERDCIIDLELIMKCVKRAMQKVDKDTGQACPPGLTIWTPIPSETPHTRTFLVLNNPL